MKTLVIGASENPTRYSYMAINSLLEHGHEVFALGNKEGEVSGIKIYSSPADWLPVDTVTLYLNPNRQKEYYDYILSLKPRRVIFNPGTENPEFYKLLRDNEIQYETACTLVLLSTGQF